MERGHLHVNDRRSRVEFAPGHLACRIALHRRELRGHGDSSAATDGCSAEQYARDMFAVANAAGARDLIVVGFSMAAKFGAAMAAIEPSRVRAQVLMAPVGPDVIDVPDEVFEGWIEAAPDPVAFRKVLAPFIQARWKSG